jgi:cephalosporin hydroxylase
MKENHPTQDPDEVAGLCEILSKLNISTILEIGMFGGGTMNIWSKFAEETALLVGVDIEDRVRDRKVYKPTQTFIKVIADSTAKGTIEQVRTALAGRQVDFLFIDGNHLYEYVKADYNNYAPFVRPGGIIAFHDTYGNAYVKKAIAEIVLLEERIAEVTSFGKPYKMGITVFRRKNASDVH